MTNREKLIMELQSKTDEELAEMLSEKLDCSKCPVSEFCASCGLEYCEEILWTWLKQEAGS